MKEYAATFGSNAAVFAVNTASSILLARILGPTVLGEYALIAATYTTMVNLCGLGINVASSTMVAGDREALHPLATHAVLAAVLVGGLPLLLYLAVAPWLDATLFSAAPPGLAAISLATVPFGLFSLFYGSLMVGLHEISLLNRLNVAGSLVVSTAQVVVVAFVQADARAVLLTTLVGAAATNAIMLALLAIKHRWRPRVDAAVLRESLSLGLRSHAGNLASYLMLRVDFYVVSALVGPTALGYYSLARSLVEKLWLAVQPIYSVAFSRIAAGTSDEAARLTARLTRVALWLLLALGVGLAAGSALLLAPVYTERFLPALGPLVWMVPGAALFGGSWFVGLYFTGHLRRPETPSKVAWSACAVSLPLYFGLTSLAGIEGAALASTLTYGVVCFGTVAAFARASGLPLARVLLPQAEDLELARGLLRR